MCGSISVNTFMILPFKCFLKKTIKFHSRRKMPGYLVEMLLKGLYLPEIYRRFSAIQQNTIFIESIARCGKGNTQQNLRQNVQPNIQQNLKENN